MIMSHFGNTAPSQEALTILRDARRLHHAQNGPEGAACAAQDAIQLDSAIAHNWPVRDQFGRGTCVAFATIAAVELNRARRDDMLPERLSEQFLHERMITTHALAPDVQAEVPPGGVLLMQAMQALESDGLIGSDRVPYKPISVGAPWPEQPDPSDDDLMLAHENRVHVHSYGTIGKARGLDADRIDPIEPGTDVARRILRFLNDGMPVVAGVPLFQHPSGLNNWTLPSAIQTGVVPCPEDADAPDLDGPRDDGHVVCLTGFQPDPDEPLGGWFVFRNSWGLEFASHAGFAADRRSAGRRGYGLLSATHVNQYCWEYLVPAPEQGCLLS